MNNQLRNYVKSIREVEASEKAGTFIVNLAGVSFDARPVLIRAIKSDTQVRLVRERSNEVDFYAVVVEAEVLGRWAQIGYLPRPFNVHVARDLDKELPVKITLDAVVGEYPNQGVRVRIDK